MKMILSGSFLALFFVTAVVAAPVSSAPASPAYEMIVLGVAQDAGYPQAGCDKACCRAHWEGREPRHFAASLALLDREGNRAWLFEATPDIKDQLELLRRKNGGRPPALAGIFSTHAHIGHYAGLIHLGREVMGSRGVPLYVLPRFAEFLRKNGPWSLLVELGNVEIRTLAPEVAVEIAPGVKVRPFLVPHRDEFSETASFAIEAGGRRVLFLPDIDKWEKWSRPIEEEVAKADIAFLDATFYDEGELPGRNLAEIPHPLVGETLRRFDAHPKALREKIRLIHLNHTNPLLTDHQLREDILARGYRVASEGDAFPLSP